VICQHCFPAVSVILQQDVTVSESEGKARIMVYKDGDNERNVSVLVSVATPSSPGVALATGKRAICSGCRGCFMGIYVAVTLKKKYDQQ